MKATPLQWKTDWCFEQSQQRRHYVIEPWLDGRRVGRAHGWFESGERFVLEKIEIDSRQRSRGYGSTVIERLRQKARDEGCRFLRDDGLLKAWQGLTTVEEVLRVAGT